MFTAKQYRAKAAEYTELLKVVSLPAETREFRKLEQSYLTLAENDEWMADNLDKINSPGADENWYGDATVENVMLQGDPWEKAADCERALRLTLDPIYRENLTNIREFWISLAHKRPFLSETEFAGEAEAIGRFHANWLRAFIPSSAAVTVWQSGLNYVASAAREVRLLLPNERTR